MHGRAPYGGFGHLFGLDDAHVGVPVKALPGFLLPVNRHWSMFVDGEGPGFGVDKQLTWSALYGQQLLPLATVEG